MGGFSIRIEQSADRYHFKLSGELDLAAVDDLNHQIERYEALMRQSDQIQRIEIDTTDLAFLDTAGLGALITARQRLGTRLHLVPGDHARHLLELTGTLGHFGFS